MNSEAALYSVESDLYTAFRALDQAAKKAKRAGISVAQMEMLSEYVFDQLQQVRKQREAACNPST